MKRIILLILSVLMIASLCIPIAGCNSTKPKPADELFFSVSDSGIIERLASSMGFNIANQKELMQNTDKNAKVVFSLGISDLTFGGMPITQSPMSASFDGVVDRNGDTAGTLNWSYMTDNLNVSAALGKDCAAVKFDDLTDYLNIAPLLENINTDNGQSAELVASLEKAMTDLGKIVLDSVDKTKITEKSEEIEVNGVKIKVRAISYTLEGEELAAFAKNIVTEAGKNAAIMDVCEKLGIPADAFKDPSITAAENEKITIVRYFEVNESRGFDVDATISEDNVNVKISSRTNCTKDTDYADIELSVAAGEADAMPLGAVNLKGLYKRENTGSFICEFTVGGGDSESLSVNLGSIKLSGTTTDTEEGKRTDITMTVGVSGAVLQIPFAVTVKKCDKDNLDVAFEMSINIPSMLSVKLTAEEKLSLTDEAVNLPEKDEFQDEAPEDLGEKLEEKLPNTVELFEMLGGIFGGIGEPDYPDDDYDYDIDM